MYVVGVVSGSLAMSVIHPKTFFLECLRVCIVYEVCGPVGYSVAHNFPGAQSIYCCDSWGPLDISN